MICYDCGLPACTKMGNAKGSLLSLLPLIGFLFGKTWDKQEKYYCRLCYHKIMEDNEVEE